MSGVGLGLGIDRQVSSGKPLVDYVAIQKSSPVKVFVPADNALGTTWQQRVFDDSAWLSGTFAVGFMNGGGASTPDLSSDLGVDLKALVPAIVSSGRNAFIRAHFTVNDPSKITKVILRVNYDDGYYIWINGLWVSNSPSAPAEGGLVFNSAAGQTHAPGSFGSDINITGAVGSAILAGDNVMAIRLMNQAPTSTDIFFWPELVITGVGMGP